VARIRLRISCATSPSRLIPPDPTRLIVFDYTTPNHARWMNHLDSLLSTLVRKLLRRGSFSSIHVYPIMFGQIGTGLYRGVTQLMPVEFGIEISVSSPAVDRPRSNIA
jgi:hypothetical protein